MMVSPNSGAAAAENNRVRGSLAAMPKSDPGNARAPAKPVAAPRGRGKLAGGRVVREHAAMLRAEVLFRLKWLPN